MQRRIAIGSSTRRNRFPRSGIALHRKTLDRVSSALVSRLGWFFFFPPSRISMFNICLRSSLMPIELERSLQFSLSSFETGYYCGTAKPPAIEFNGKHGGGFATRFTRDEWKRAAGIAGRGTKPGVAGTRRPVHLEPAQLFGYRVSAGKSITRYPININFYYITSARYRLRHSPDCDRSCAIRQLASPRSVRPTANICSRVRSCVCLLAGHRSTRRISGGGGQNHLFVRCI